MPIGKQIIGGREYVYEYRSVWNKEKKRSEQKREYIGRVIDGEIVPSKGQRLKQELKKKGADKGCKRLFAGAVRLFDMIGKATGVAKDMKACFPAFHKELLSLAYYLALEPSLPLYRFKRWASSHRHPYGRDIPSQRSSELLGRITEASKMSFLRRQARRRSEAEYLFYDSTSISSYSEQIKQVRYGKNKDGDSLAQINLALLFGQESGLPVYYRKLPGNITDVMTIEGILAGIDYLEIKKAGLVMDRGFYSEKNLNAMFSRGHKFVVGAKMSLKPMQAILVRERGKFGRRENYDKGTGLFMRSYPMEWASKEGRVVYVHIYYSEQLATDEKAQFSRLLDGLEEDIALGKRSEGRDKLYSKYYEIEGVPLKKAKPKQGAIDEAQKNFGYFALLSNDIEDPSKALMLYRSKDMIEKAFSDLKDRLNMRRTSVSSEENLEGKLFVQFVALIYLSYVKRAMDRAGLFKHYTMQELFDELDVIEEYVQPGKPAYYGEITEKQRKLYSALGFQLHT